MLECWWRLLILVMFHLRLRSHRNRTLVTWIIWPHNNTGRHLCMLNPIPFLIFGRIIIQGLFSLNWLFPSWCGFFKLFENCLIAAILIDFVYGFVNVSQYVVDFNLELLSLLLTVIYSLHINLASAFKILFAISYCKWRAESLIDVLNLDRTVHFLSLS